MADCDDEPDTRTAASSGCPEELCPRWTQDEAIAFACARDYLAELQAAYATAVDELSSQPNADVSREEWLRGELALLKQQRRDLTVHDRTAIAEIRATFQARFAGVYVNE